MKTKFNLLIAYAALAGSCLLNSCAKDGETGPAGPSGATGATGSTGNANVKSYNFKVLNSDWTIQSSTSWQYTYPCPGITPDVMDSGMVMVYWDANNLSPNSHNYVPMPVVPWQINGRVLSSSWQVDFSYQGTVTVGIYDYTGTPIPTQSSILFRVVVVSGKKRLANPNINWNNYQEVKAALNLQD